MKYLKFIVNQNPIHFFMLVFLLPIQSGLAKATLNLKEIKNVSFKCTSLNELLEAITFCSDNRQASESAKSCLQEIKNLWKNSEAQLASVFSKNASGYYPARMKNLCGLDPTIKIPLSDSRI